MSTSSKKNILLVGGGGVGALAAVNLESGGLASVCAVLRSNHEAVTTSGYNIESCDWGSLKNWRPSKSTSRYSTIKADN